MKIGVMQGRLSVPVDGAYQEFPRGWEKEFQLIKECGFECVEWLVTTNSAVDNPLFKETDRVAKHPVSSVCLDVLINEKITDPRFLNKYLVSTCEVIIKTPYIRNLTIPLLEKSDMGDDATRQLFCSLIQPIGKRFPEINFSFEAELPHKKLEEIVRLSSNFYVTYDTGNITSCGFDHTEYINFFSTRINNVHLKDRTFDAETVPPLKGDTDFKTIFNELKMNHYKGPFILQAARQKSGNEKQTILEYKRTFEQLYS
jgi:hexulose-6-phosphate isomerase